MRAESGPLTVKSPGAGLLVALVVTDLAFAFQQTAVIPAIPTIRDALHARQEWAAWLLSIYLIAATVATPALARLADLRDARRVLLVALGVFLAGSVLGAVAPNIWVLLGARLLQGVGGAVFPLSLSLAREQLPPDRGGRAAAVLTGAFGAGSVMGFAVGGVFAQYADWRLIFASGAVAVLVGGLLVRRNVTTSESRAHGRYDGVGTALLATGAVGLLVALTIGRQVGWVSWPVIALAVLTAVAVASLVRWELRREDPLVDLGLFRNRPVLLANGAAVGLGWALFSAYLLIPRLVEADPGRTGYGLGAGAALTGFVLLPAALLQTVASSVAGRIAGRVGQGRVLVGGMGVVVAGGIVLALSRADVALLLVGVALLGAGAGTAIEACSSIATSAVPGDVAAVSAALNSTVRRLGGGIGSQVGVLVLSASALSVGRTPDAPPYVGFVIGFTLVAAWALLGGIAALFIRSSSQAG